MAKNTLLEPGQHTVDRNEPKWSESKQAYRHRFSVRLRDGKLIKDKFGQASTKTEARRRALKLANELLRTGGNRGAWKPTSPLRGFIEGVTLPEIAKVQNAHTRGRYMLAVGQLLGCRYADEGHAADCDETGLHPHPCTAHPGEKHTADFRGHSIASAVRFRAIEANLQDIARLHGEESARQARTVLGKYVIGQLIREELVMANPIAGQSIDISTMAKGRDEDRGERQALTRDQWRAVIEHLLAVEPDAEKPKRGRWSLEDRIAKRRNTIDLALLQAVTGARQFEGTGITWDRLDRRDDGEVVAELHGKGGVIRWVPLFDPDVAEHLLARRQGAPGSWPVIGSPSDPSKPWERDNANKAARALYDELAEALGIPALATKWGRSHVWRETLNTMLRALGVPEEIRAAYFGHDTEINRRHYTDMRNVEPLVEARKRLREGSSSTAESTAE